MVKPFSFGVALTGSIATGKSTISSWLKEDGFMVIDADKTAHNTLEEEKKEVIKYFGKEILVNNKIDRKMLGQIVFNEPEKRKKLESILHPIILDKITTLAKKNDLLKKLYFIDIPLFFENKNYDIAKVLVVYTPLNKQLERLISRDKYSEKEALQRIASQISIGQKAKKATYLIDNSDTLSKLKKNYQKILQQIKGDFNASN